MSAGNLQGWYVQTSTILSNFSIISAKRKALLIYNC